MRTRHLLVAALFATVGTGYMVTAASVTGETTVRAIAAAPDPVVE
jgi:hypothetical protein